MGDPSEKQARQIEQESGTLMPTAEWHLKVLQFLSKAKLNNKIISMNTWLPVLVEAKTLWVLGMPLFLPNCFLSCLVFCLQA